MIDVMLNNELDRPAPEATMAEAVRGVLRDHGVRRGEVSLAVIDDAKMRQLNRTHLQHDYPTDVLSFLLCRNDDHLEGEVIVSGETAARAGHQYGSSFADELLLYVIHGTLHLVGYDDQNEADRRAMRDAETRYLRQHGRQPLQVIDAEAAGRPRSSSQETSR